MHAVVCDYFEIAHPSAQKAEMKEFMTRFSNLILLEMERRKCSATYFADICGVSRNEIGAIISKKKRDLKMSTVIKICRGAGLCPADIFSDSKDVPFETALRQYRLTNGKNEYFIHKAEGR